MTDFENEKTRTLEKIYQDTDCPNTRAIVWVLLELYRETLSMKEAVSENAKWHAFYKWAFYGIVSVGSFIFAMQEHLFGRK